LKNRSNIIKPIFIVGHARGGSTLLSSIINAHSKVGPKHFDEKMLDTEILKDYRKHLDYSEKLEQKDIWFKYFKGKNCFTHIGKEIYENELSLKKSEINSLVQELTDGFKEERFLSKTPTNSFRIKPIIEIFPDCKILVILRNGEEVVGSWGKRHYGFGKRVNWGEVSTEKLSYYKGINVFVRKWQEVVQAIEKVKHLENVLILTYQDLTDNTSTTLQKVFEFLELPYEEYIGNISLSSNKDNWKRDLPLIYRLYLLKKVKFGNEKIELLSKTNK